MNVRTRNDLEGGKKRQEEGRKGKHTLVLDML